MLRAAKKRAASLDKGASFGARLRRSNEDGYTFIALRGALFSMTIALVVIPRIGTFLMEPLDDEGKNVKWEALSALGVPVCFAGILMAWFLAIERPDLDPKLEDKDVNLPFLEQMHYYVVGCGYFGPRLVVNCIRAMQEKPIGVLYTLANVFGLFMVLVMHKYFVRVWKFIRADAKKRDILRNVPGEAVVSLSAVFMFSVYALGPSVVCYGMATSEEIISGSSVCHDHPPSWADSKGRDCSASYYHFECSDGFVKSNTSVLKHANSNNISALEACCACGGGTLEFDGIDPCLAGQSVDFIVAYQSLLSWMARAVLMNVKQLSLTQLFALNVNKFQAISLTLFAVTSILTVLVFGARDQLEERKELYQTTQTIANVFIALWLGIFCCLMFDTFIYGRTESNEQEDKGNQPHHKAAAVPPPRGNQVQPHHNTELTETDSAAEIEIASVQALSATSAATTQTNEK
jgi:hypothetical protein